MKLPFKYSMDVLEIISAAVAYEKAFAGLALTGPAARLCSAVRVAQGRDPVPFQIGDFVEITGSETRPEIVGKRGIIAGHSSMNGACAVVTGSETYYTTEDNLKMLKVVD
jgi:hypothetical protein